MNKIYFENILKRSLTYSIYKNIRTFLFNAPVLKYFFNPYKLTPLWHESRLFGISEIILSNLRSILNLVIPKKVKDRIENYGNDDFYERLIGKIILLAALIPSILNGAAIFSTISFIWAGVFLIKNKNRRASVSYTAALVIFFIFYITYSIYDKGNYAIILFTPLLIFITASFSLNKNSKTYIINGYILISVIILSTLIITAEIFKITLLKNRSYYVNIITILTPPALSRALNEKGKFRRIFYTFVSVVFSATAAALSKSLICYTAYSASILLFITLIKPKILFYILLVTPAVVKIAANYIINAVRSHMKYSSPAENIISASKNIWQNSLGAGSKPFINAYSSLAKQSSGYVSYIDERYIEILHIIGFIFLFIFLWFVLKTMRACIMKVFKSKGAARIRLAAGVSFLIASSVSAFVAANVHSPNVTIIYWLTLATQLTSV